MPARYGRRCLTPCSKEENGELEDYTWCRTTAHQLHWDYCGLQVRRPNCFSCLRPQGVTIHGEECVDSCGPRGQSYWWCRVEEGGWDYCSPPGQVAPGLTPRDLTVHLQVVPVTYASHGQECVSECGRSTVHWQQHTFTIKNDFLLLFLG